VDVGGYRYYDSNTCGFDFAGACEDIKAKKNKYSKKSIINKFAFLPNFIEYS